MSASAAARIALCCLCVGACAGCSSAPSPCSADADCGACARCFDGSCVTAPAKPGETCPCVEADCPCLGPDCKTRWVSAYYDPARILEHPASAIDFSAITHLLVQRLDPHAEGSVGERYEAWLTADLARRAHQAGRRALFVLGGDTPNDPDFTAACAPTTRPQFVAALLDLMSARGYDGFEIDWQPFDPVTDGPQLLALATDLRAGAAARGLSAIVLTIPVQYAFSNAPLTSPDGWFANAAISLTAAFDQINVRTWAMSGVRGGWASWHFAPLFGEASDHPTSVAHSLQAYAQRGIAKDRLGLGIAFHGTCWRGVRGALQPLSGAIADSSDSVFTFANIKARYRDPNPAAYAWDESAQQGSLSFAQTYTPPDWVPVASPYANTGCDWISFEDEQSVSAKSDWLKQEGYGGVALWLPGNGVVDGGTPANPLLDAVRTAILGSR